MNSIAAQGIRMALGTAQLGMPYGIANTSGQPDYGASLSIVRHCWKGGVRYFDTAQAYGVGEAVLGRCLASLGVQSQVRVTTKLDPKQDAEAVRDAVKRSLRKLGLTRLWALLLHSESKLDLWNERLGREFRNLKHVGLTERLGVSVYSPRRALQAIELPDIDVVQVPANVFDRRMKRIGLFQRADELGKTVFIRSVYLQGLALMDSSKVPAFARTAVGVFESFCSERQLERRKFAVDYVRHMSSEAFLVIGAELPEQARENCLLMRQPRVESGVFGAWEESWPEDQMPLVNPSQWPQNRRRTYR